VPVVERGCPAGIGRAAEATLERNRVGNRVGNRRKSAGGGKVPAVESVLAGRFDVGVVLQELAQFAFVQQIADHAADGSAAMAAASGNLQADRFVSWFVVRSVGLHDHGFRFRC